MKIISLMDSGVACGETISAILQKDQTLTLKVLGIANSPFFGLSGRINTLQDACVVLGFTMLKNIVVASSVIDTFPLSTTKGLDVEALWRHGFRTAIAADRIARQLKLDRGTAFLSGMLHDAGILVLSILFPEHYEKVLDYRNEHACPLKDAEHAVLGLSHADVGGELIVHWNLPSALVDPVAGHHNPDAYPDNPMVGVIHAANMLSRMFDEGAAQEGLKAQTLSRITELLDLNEDFLDELIAEIEQASQECLAMAK